MGQAHMSKPFVNSQNFSRMKCFSQTGWYYATIVLMSKENFPCVVFFCSQIDFGLRVTTMCLCKNISWILLTVKLISKEWIHTYKDKWKWHVNKFLKDFTFKETGCAHQEMTRDQLNDTTTSVLFFAVKPFDLGSVEIVWKCKRSCTLQIYK